MQKMYGRVQGIHYRTISVDDRRLAYHVTIMIAILANPLMIYCILYYMYRYVYIRLGKQ